MPRLEEKAIIVTGAAGAIGGATAAMLASEGARVLIADLRRDALDQLAAEIARQGGRPPVVATYDAMSSLKSAALVDQAVETLGRLDAICHIGGIYSKARFTDAAETDWARMLQINLTSVAMMTRAAIPRLLETQGSVVMTSSLAALKGHPYATAYAVAKAGLIALTKSLAAEYATGGVRFNVICPGGVRSGMSAVPAVVDADPDLVFRRSKLKGLRDGLGEARDIAAAFAYLLSDDARYVSGTTLVVDGAQSLI